jgi:hypothetical protein
MAKYVQTVKKPDGRVYYYTRIPTENGYISIPLPADHGAAQLAAAVMHKETSGHFGSYIRKTDATMDEVCRYAASLIYMARERAAKQNVPFSLTKKDISDMVRRQNYCCCVTDIPFTMKSVGKDNFSRAFAPSIDRIVPAEGYTPDNIRIVCRIVNFAASKWGIDPVLVMARALCRRKKTETAFANDFLLMQTRRGARS